MLSKIINYLKSVKQETDKVTWPTKKETTNYSILVVVISLSVAFFLGGLDYIFSILLNFLIQLR